MDTTQTQSLNPPMDAQNLTPQEMADNLKKLMLAVTDKMNLFNGQKKVSDSQLTAVQNNAIGQLFNILKENGVDPSNQDSVNIFLQQLMKDNPQGYIFLEKAINSLLSQKNILDKIGPPDNFAEPLNPMDQIGQEPQSPDGITSTQMPIPNPIPQSMNEPNAQSQN